MEIYKLKMKIDGHEFEAEGPVDVVKADAAEFKEMVKGLPSSAVDEEGLDLAAISRAHQGEVPPKPKNLEEFKAMLKKLGIGYVESPKPEQPAETVDSSLNRIMSVDDRIVSLTVQARSIEDAVLLLLYGQKALRSNDSVTGGEIMSGLEMSGVKVGRADRYLVKLKDAGDAIAVGIGRAKRYRLTNAGLAKGRAIAAELIATVA